jgi:hypothetical protein
LNSASQGEKMADSLISGAATADAPTTDTTTVTSNQTSEQDQRPDWLPENFWIEGKPHYENLAKSYNEIRTKFGSKEDDLRTRIIDELSAEAIAGRPEAVDKYELPEIEGINVQEVASHPLTKWWADFAFDNGFDQDTFKTGIAKYIEAKVSDQPNYEVELKALGDNANARTEAVGLWVNKNFDQTERLVVEKICTTADGVKVMEKVMNMLKDGGSASAFEPPPEVTDKDVEKMMQDRRYWNSSDRDPAFVAKIESHFRKKYGSA